jgi:predicted amidophosphoribosyltransferase
MAPLRPNICPKCGEPINAGIRFCGRCGTPVSL